MLPLEDEMRENQRGQPEKKLMVYHLIGELRWPCEGYTCCLGFLLHVLGVLLASNLHKQPSQPLSRYQRSVLQE